MIPCSFIVTTSIKLQVLIMLESFLTNLGKRNDSLPRIPLTTKQSVHDLNLKKKTKKHTHIKSKTNNIHKTTHIKYIYHI